MNSDNTTVNNKLIAKNAIFLYIRMIIIMLITLFTSREILRVLGIDDFGIYNVVGGIVVLFSFLNTALVSSSQRFLSFELGKGESGEIKKTFGICLTTHFLIVGLIVLIAETIGLWFVLNELNIPDDKMTAVSYVYQFSVATFVLNVLRIPYNSVIIAYERMDFYAYVSIIESVLKLVVVYLLLISDIEYLIFYSFLLLIVSLIVLIVYYIFVRLKFKSCRYEFEWDRDAFVSMVSFSGWSMLGGMSNVAAHQGGNILLNIYSSLSANASFGVANQVSQAVYAFSSNLQVAFNPQIIKQYSIGNMSELYKLTFRSSLASYYMMLIFAVPFVFNADYILGIWLTEVPSFAPGFCIIMILYQLVDAIQAPINTLIHATGIIKNYYIWLSALIFLCLPVSWFFLLMGFSAYVVVLIRLINNVVTAVIRVFYMNAVIAFPTRAYLKDVVLKSTIVTIMSVVFAYFLTLVISDNVIFNITITIIGLFFICLFFGFNNDDRHEILLLMRKKLNFKHV